MRIFIYTPAYFYRKTRVPNLNSNKLPAWQGTHSISNTQATPLPEYTKLSGQSLNIPYCKINLPDTEKSLSNHLLGCVSVGVFAT